MPTGLISPVPDGSLRRWFAWVSRLVEPNGPSETADCRGGNKGPPRSLRRQTPEDVCAIARTATEGCNRQRRRHCNSPQTNAWHARATSRHATLCLGGMTDALRDSVAKRIAGWVSDYRSIQGYGPGPPGTPSGTPRPGGSPGGPGKFPGNFRPRAGPPGGAPGTPILGPPGPPKWAQNRPFSGPF